VDDVNIQRLINISLVLFTGFAFLLCIFYSNYLNLDKHSHEAVLKSKFENKIRAANSIINFKTEFLDCFLITLFSSQKFIFLTLFFQWLFPTFLENSNLRL